jgi:hypothetical protein
LLIEISTGISSEITSIKIGRKIRTDLTRKMADRTSV